MSSINFVNVYLLFIAIPLVALITVPFAIAVRRGNVNKHNIASLVIHLLMAALITFATAGMSVLTVVTETDVYVVADISYSADRNLDTVDSYIGELNKNLPQNSKLGIITFGRNCEVLTKLGEKIKSVKTSVADNTETNIAGALEFAGRQFGEGVIKRIVLITDGKQTDTSDANAVKRAVDALADKDIKVDAIYLDDNIDANANEVQISEAEFTRSAYQNREEKVTATIRSSFITTADVTLLKDGEVVETKSNEYLDIGFNTVSFDLDTSTDGTFDYVIRVDAKGDTSKLNNSYSFTQSVSEIVRVLMISSSSADIAAAKKLYDGSTQMTTYTVGVGSNATVPCTVEELCHYDEIILSNVDVTSLNNYSLFVESLEAAVNLCGKSLVTIGDLGVQTLRDDEDENAALEKLSSVLPVNFGNNSQDRKLYGILIDTSLSMNSLDKFVRAKTAAINLLKQIGDNDSVCVLGFNGNLTYRKGPVLGISTQDIIDDLENVDLQNGTLIGFGLNEAYKLLDSYTGYDSKQVMLISDGLDYLNGSDNPDDTALKPKEVVEQMFKNGIYTSVIDIGRAATSPGSANYEEINAAETLLKSLPDGRYGKYYLGDTDEKLKDVLFGDIAGGISQTVISQNSAVTVNRRTSEVLENVEFPSTLGISTFVNSATQSGASEILSVTYTKTNGLKVTAPLYSTWNYGNGKVSSFTSGITGDWVRLFEPRFPEIYAQFFGNVMSTNVPNEKTDYPFLFKVTPSGTSVRVELTPVSLRADSSATISITKPDGKTVNGKLRVEGANFSYEFDAAAVGKYGISVKYSYGDNEYEATYSYNVSFTPEYDAFASFDPAGLQKAVGGNGTVSLDGKLKIVNDDRNVESYSQSLAVPLLIACAALFVIDIAIRKLKWEDIVSLFKKIK
ncbi:MAG: VWA domain-containing protein [Clostridia bacterium]|nr:VWA domain-containing protein [Clostridia bacterium]